MGWPYRYQRGCQGDDRLGIINAVRIPLNEDCWLRIYGVKPAYSRSNYRSAIADYVSPVWKGLGLLRQ